MRTRSHRLHRPPRRPLRRSLRASVYEGVLAEVFNACAGPTILVGWAITLRFSAAETALVVSLPQFAQLVQVPGAWAAGLVGRRRLALFTIGASRQAFLPLALVPFLAPDGAAARALLLAVAAASAVLGMAGNVAWTAWMGDLVPARIRGRYFGRRTAVCVLAGTAASLVAARLLDRARGPGASLALAGLALASSLVGAGTVLLLARQHEPAAPAGPGPGLAGALRPLRDPQARGVLAYLVSWNASVGLAGAYFTWHLLGNLRASFVVVALHAGGSALAKVLSAPFFGRAVDRIGARPVLAAASFGSAVLPLLWLAATPRSLWPLAIDAALGGVAWGAHGLASFSVPLALAPRRDRAFYVAAFSSAGGLAYVLGTAAGGALLGALAPAGAAGTVHGLRVLFVLSAGGRLASALLALRMAGPCAGKLAAITRLARAQLASALAR